MPISCVNAAVGAYADVRYDKDGHASSFLGMFDSLAAVADHDGLPVLPDFRIVTRVCVPGSVSDRESILNRGGKLLFRVRLTKHDPDPEKRLGKDLGAFELDLGDSDVRRSICSSSFDYINSLYVTDVRGLVLDPGFGDYSVKLLVAVAPEDREPEDSDFTVQAAWPLHVGRKGG